MRLDELAWRERRLVELLANSQAAYEPLPLASKQTPAELRQALVLAAEASLLDAKHILVLASSSTGLADAWYDAWLSSGSLPAALRRINWPGDEIVTVTTPINFGENHDRYLSFSYDLIIVDGGIKLKDDSALAGRAERIWDLISAEQATEQELGLAGLHLLDVTPLDWKATVRSRASALAEGSSLARSEVA
jgi:hypothetical protein